jgi:AraC-like DNA-binding protein
MDSMYNLRDSAAAAPGPAEAASRSDWQWDLTQLTRGETRALPTILALNGVFVGKAGGHHALLHRIRAPSVTLLFCAGNAGTLYVEGYRLSPNDCIVLSPNAEIEAVTHNHSEAVAVSVSVSEAKWADAVRGLQERGLLLRPGVHLAGCGRISEALYANPTPQAMSAAITEQLRAVDARMSAEPARRKRNRRHQGVELARQYIKHHIADPIRLADLCEHARLRPRSLEYGFREILRASPMSYVKVLRLNAVNHQLREDLGARRSISEIALDAGFRHLSQFAVDYKRLFLESPSATRRSVTQARSSGLSRGRAPRPEDLVYSYRDSRSQGDSFSPM